ncbi:putative F-box/kelch-repeat protein At1g20940 [Arabidopsis lyrata subsp. lyrata]|uniref:putative F-box/kelch-repeat protein At1g20940 n=1 Tax=Arabidopsis lyrata subsp. lyrata TaxID=81972 RepID=UPI000A29CB05|nr:putative F-box/kelch-repeat protein At1g20940 [Arabidopsis lyrata subsp. lyrata]|eukprot:XP_020866831.1 putative F-box/kelch-repeat protein At1g20940 [Arabidopsis lyrata subsp. lyrata]
MIMNDLPLHLLDEILFRLEPKSMAMMRCTNKSIKSYLTDPRFGPQYPLWVRSNLINLSTSDRSLVGCQPLVSSSDSVALEYIAGFINDRCYIFGSCSGLLLIYIGHLFVANPLTKKFRILNHSGSKLLPHIVGCVEKYDPYDPDGPLVRRTERAMCVGFVVDPSQTTKRFKIVCILEMETKYRFEISDGDSWRLSKTTLTTSSKSGLKTRIKPVYVDGNLHWLRNDWSLIAFNPETEQARLIPCSFHPTPDTKVLFAAKDKINPMTLISGTIKEISIYTLLGNHKWALERQIKNVSMEKTRFKYWNVVAYDGKCLVVLENNVEADSWRVLGGVECWSEDFYMFTPSYFSIEEDEQTKVIVASDDQHISYLTTLLEVIDPTSQRDLTKRTNPSFFTGTYRSGHFRCYQF